MKTIELNKEPSSSDGGNRASDLAIQYDTIKSVISLKISELRIIYSCFD